MSNLNQAKPKTVKIKLNDGVERELKFTLNAMADLEDRYGSVEKAFEALESNSMKAVRFVLWAGLAACDENLTERQVGSLIDVNCMDNIMKAVTEAFGNDMPDQYAQGEPKMLPNA